MSQVERTEPLKVLSPSPPLLPGAVRGLPLSPPVTLLMPPPPDCPRSPVKVSPRPLPRTPGVKGGVPFSPLGLISQFVPVPLPFITNKFFPGSPETIDSFFHHLLHNGYKSFLKEHSNILTLAFSQDFMSIFLTFAAWLLHKNLLKRQGAGLQ